MRRQLRVIAISLTVLAVSAAGCVTPAGEPVDSQTVDTPAGLTLVQGPDGAPAPFAAVSFLDAEGDAVAIRSADAEGLVPAAAPPSAARAVVTAPGAGAWEGAPPLPAVVRLPTPPAGDAANIAPGLLRFDAPLLLGGAYLGGAEGSCAAYNCGASEPVIEVAGDGTIYASGTCCIGESPPIWVSHDGGDSFQRLEGDALRDNYGIEGDFAIDDAGNLYFSDISVASAYFSSWNADGEHRWTVPAGPFVPLVDRPWVRAGAEDQVYFLYNTARSTMFYTSSDGGLTWTPRHQFPGPLGNIGQGPERAHLWVAVGYGEAGPTLYESTDGGASWSDGEAIPTPTEEGERFQAVMVPVVDASGRVWVVYDWRAEGEDAYHVYAARRDPDGSWAGPYQVSPDAGTHHLPWAAAGRDGALVVAWYGTLDDAAGPNDVAADAAWRLFAAATVDGGSDTPGFQVALADPQPVHEGPMNRKLLDFLQVEIGPRGAVHVAYAQDRNGQPDELTQYVRTHPGVDLNLAPAEYPNGPHA